MWMGPDERGTNTVGLALIAVLLLLVLAATTEFGRVFVGLDAHRVGDAANVAAQQRQAFQGGYAAPLRQHTQLGVAAQSSRGPTSQQVRSSIASLPARWSNQLGEFLFEILPEDIRSLVEIFRNRAHQLVE
jgi:hypothetical protein